MAVAALAAGSVVWGVWGVGGLGGCSVPMWGSGGLAAAPVDGAVQLWGDWDDLDAAMDVAAERSEMAIIHVSDPEGAGLRRVYELRTVAAEPGQLTATRPAAQPPGGPPQVITVEVQIGRFGDPARQGRLVEQLRRRLTALRGVDHAPVE